jgi:hypothetical protein
MKIRFALMLLGLDRYVGFLFDLDEAKDFAKQANSDQDED